MVESKAPVPAKEPRRLYRLMRLGAGDYLMFDNERRDLWRLSTYTEDGSAVQRDAVGKERQITGQFWQASRFTGQLDRDSEGRVLGIRQPADPDYDPLEDWDLWASVAALLKTRRAAERYVLVDGQG